MLFFYVLLILKSLFSVGITDIFSDFYNNTSSVSHSENIKACLYWFYFSLWNDFFFYILNKRHVLLHTAGKLLEISASEIYRFCFVLAIITLQYPINFSETVLA